MSADEKQAELVLAGGQIRCSRCQAFGDGGDAQPGGGCADAGGGRRISAWEYCHGLATKYWATR